MRMLINIDILGTISKNPVKNMKVEIQQNSAASRYYDWLNYWELND